jgi:sulfur carrier protein ThiS
MIDQLDELAQASRGAGTVIVIVNGRRVWVGDNVTVALLLRSLGYPARGVAAALN